jgi:hypothetical protein
MMPGAPDEPRTAGPSIIIALELIGLDAPDISLTKARRALSQLVLQMGESARGAAKQRDAVIVGPRALSVAPIKPGGTLLFWELLDVLHLQGELIGAGVLVRGAVTLGEVAVVPNFRAGRGITATHADTFLGPGIAEAERLRDTVADVHRVVVDPRLLAEVEHNPHLRAPHHTAELELGYVRDLLRADGDGLWFVDYLRAFAKEVDDPSFYLTYLADHADLVNHRLASFTGVDHEARRWMWSWRYHNRVIHELHQSEILTDEGRTRLRLPAEGPLFFNFPPSPETD